MRILLICALVCCCLGLSCGDQDAELRSDVEQHPTPEWREFVLRGDPFDQRPAYLVSPSRGVIYFALQNWASLEFETDVVYVYDTVGKALTASTLGAIPTGDEDHWESVMTGSNPIAGPWPVCDLWRAEGVSLGGTCLALEGRSLAFLSYSPSEQLFSILSADGDHPEPRRTVWGPGAPTVNAYGQHYLQLASRASGGKIGPAVRIAIATAEDQGEAGWLGGDDFIAVVPKTAEWISVIHVADFLPDSATSAGP